MSKIVPVMLLIFFFISGTLIIAVSPVLATELVGDSWYEKTSMKQARTGMGVVAINDKIYVIGGTRVGSSSNSNDSYVGTNECYDPASDSWVTLKSMPTPRKNFVIVAFEGKIYCIGGISGVFIHQYGGVTYITSNAVEVYDTVTDSWSIKSSASIFGSGHAQVIDRKIFVMTDDGYLWLYDPIANSWTEKTSHPFVVRYRYNIITDSWDKSGQTLHNLKSSVVVDDKIIFFYNDIDNFLSGAKFSFSFYEKIIIYDPKTDSWGEEKTGPNSSENSSVTAAVLTTGMYAPQKAYLLKYAEDSTTDNLVYDPLKDKWTTSKPMPTTSTTSIRNAVIIDDIIYVIQSTQTYQYIPIGYSSTPFITKQLPNPSNSNPAESYQPYESFVDYHVIAILALIVGIVVIGLFFYYNRKKYHKIL